MTEGLARSMKFGFCIIVQNLPIPRPSTQSQHFHFDPFAKGIRLKLYQVIEIHKIHTSILDVFHSKWCWIKANWLKIIEQNWSFPLRCLESFDSLLDDIVHID